MRAPFIDARDCLDKMHPPLERFPTRQLFAAGHVSFSLPEPADNNYSSQPTVVGDGARVPLIANDRKNSKYRSKNLKPGLPMFRKRDNRPLNAGQRPWSSFDLPYAETVQP
jgi:hypothetical protein